MIRIITFLFLLLAGFSFACQSSRQASASDQQEASSGERDGSSYEKAVKVKNIGQEYDWLRKNCNGCKFVQQSLQQNKGKYYDVLTVELHDGSKKDYYFDINSFYGKF